MRVRQAIAADLPEIAQIHIASWRDNYRGFVPDAFIDAKTTESENEMWARYLARFPENLTVAEAPDTQITGFCCAGLVTETLSGPYEFEVQTLHARPDMRRTGVGAALLRHAIARARDALHMHSMIVWTFEASHLARRFYEREGGTLVKQARWEVGGVECSFVAYGWEW